MADRSDKKPGAPGRSTLLGDALEWTGRGARREWGSWVALVRYLGILFPVGVAALIGLVFYLQPLPPAKAYLGTGQVGTAQRMLSEKFARIFARYGVELVLVDTGGAVDNLRRLHDEGSPVNVSFSIAGTAEAAKFPTLVSLGSVQFSPVWLFYRGAPPSPDDPFGFLSGYKVAIGALGTGTRTVLAKLWSLHSQQVPPSTDVYALPHNEAAQQLIDGKIDAVFLVDGIDSPIVQQLVRTPGIGIYSFDLVDAYEKKFPFLDKVVVPRGSLDVDRVFPAKDVDMLATSVTVLAERDTHPMVQWLFLIAAREIGRERDQFFAKAGTFPAYLDQSIPLSPIAERYFNSGVPILAEYLPLWLAVLIDRVWIQLLAIFGLIVPLFSKLLEWRSLPASKHLKLGFEDLRELEERGLAVTSRTQGEAVLAELDVLLKRMNRVWYNGRDLLEYYDFLGSLDGVRGAIEARIAALGD